MSTHLQESATQTQVTDDHGLFQLLGRLASDIASSLETNAILNTAADGLRKALQSRRVLIRRFPEIGKSQIVTESRAEGVESFSDFTVPGDSPVLAELKSGTVAIVYPQVEGVSPKRVDDYMQTVQPIAGCKAFIYCPITVDGTLWGNLSVHGDPHRDSWKPAEVELAKAISGQLSAAIKNSRLYQSALDGKRKIEASEQYLQKVISSINYGVVVIEPDFRIAYVNPLMAKILGYSVEELSQMDSQIMVSPESLSIVKSEFTKRREGMSGTYEVVLISKTGERVPVLISSSPLSFHDKFQGSVSVITDLRERRQLEEQLRQTEQSRLSLIESAPLVMVVTDYRGRIKFVNQSFESLFGYTKAEIEANPLLWRNLILPEDREHLRQELAKMVKSDRFYEVEYRCQAKDGRLLWLSQITLPIRNSAGQIVGFESWAHNITKRREAEGQVRRLAHTVESIGELVIASDLDGYITYANRAALARLGYTSDELVRRPASALRDPAELTGNRGLNEIPDPGWQGEVRLLTKSGEIFPVYLTTSPITDDDGRTVAVVGIARDVSEQKRIEEREIRHRRQLTAINEAGRSISSMLNLNDALKVVTNCLCSSFGATDAIAYLVARRDDQAQKISLSAATGCSDSPTFENISLKLGSDSPLKSAITNCRPTFGQLVDDAANLGMYYAVYPLIFSSKVPGLLVMFTSAELQDDEKELIASLASQAAITIENARLFAAQQDEVEITKALLEVSTIIAERDTLSNILERIVALTGRLLDADACVHFRFDEETELFVPDAYHGLPDEFLEEFKATYVRTSDSQAAATIFYDRRPVIIDNVQDSPLKLSKLMTKMGVRSLIVLPLTAKSRLFGTINVLYFNKAHHFTLKEIAIAEGIAVHTAVALDNAELYSKIEEHRQELMSLSRKVVEAQEEERRRISRELHDEAGQALTAIKINIEMVERELPADKSAFRRRLVEAKELVDLTLQEVRRLSHELRPSILDDLGLLAALRWYTHNFSKRTGIAVSLSPEEMPDRLPPEIETTLYRVVQEALTNVVRHSGARLVTINLYRNKGRCRMIVCDDGHGVSSDAQSDGIGLLGMRERVRLFGGSVILESLERGAQLIVDVPVDSRVAE